MQQRILTAILIGAMLAGCGKRDLIQSAPSISETLTDGAQRTVRLQHEARRVVSLSPNITEILFAIGAGDKLVARSSECLFPPEAQNLPAIPLLPSLDMDSLAATKADVVFSTTDVFPPKTADAIEQRSQVPMFLQRYNSMADIQSGIRELGKVMHCDTQAAHLADSLGKVTARVKAATEGQIRYGTVMLVSTEPLRAVGGFGLLNELIQLSGGKNLLGDRKEAYLTLTPEQLQQLQPEYIIIPTQNDQAYGALLSQYPILTATPAEAQHHVFLVDSEYYLHPGPRTLSALLQLTQILHTNLTPDKFLEAKE